MIMNQLILKTWVSLILISMTYLTASASAKADKYINEYSSIAESEMMRVGIPASIKLAQGLLESNWGQSTLATKANNHFGIKCGSSWTGKEMYRGDDDYGRDGKLMQSCFRAYDSAFESYMAHSKFLMRSRYAGLFDLSTMDYSGWAHGLKKAGYATDPKYTKKLIQIIEKYELYRFDIEMNPNFIQEEVVNNATLPAVDISEYSKPTVSLKPTVAPENAVVIARKGNNTSKREEIKQTRKDRIREDKIKDRNRKYHSVSSNETMEDIASAYGLPLRKLYAYNRIPEGSSVLPGQEIKLNGYIHWGRKPKYVMNNNYLNDKQDSKEELLFEGNLDTKD